MFQFLILNFISHAIAGIPFVVLFKKRLIFQFSVFLSVYSIVTIHGLIPFQHPTFTRQLDNTLTCLLFSYLASFVINHGAVDLLLPIFTLALFIGIMLGRFNPDMSAFAVETGIVALTGLQQIFTRKHIPRIKNWYSIAFALMWMISNFCYLALSNNAYMEIVQRSVTGIAFGFIVMKMQFKDSPSKTENSNPAK
jgi:hypothetical protein